MFTYDVFEEAKDWLQGAIYNTHWLEAFFDVYGVSRRSSEVIAYLELEKDGYL